jgi:fructose-bisphosphate aldolase class II
MFKNYDGVLKVDGDVGNKKVYDPRVYGKAAEKSMIARIGVSCDELRSSGQTLFG